MRIVTWNCQGGLDKKEHVLEELAADICVVQEANASVRLATKAGITSVYGVPYEGAPKGTIVLAREPWTVVNQQTIDGQPWVIPTEVRNTATGETLNLFAMWTNTGGNDGRPHYAGQFEQFLKTLRKETPLKNTIVLGDLNASMQGPSKSLHRHNLDTAAELGLVSLYHHANNHQHGDEPDMTLKWIGPGKTPYFYHCDFIFASADLTDGAKCFVQPTFAEPKPPSDHQPVVADIVVP